jgi:hypothetical protein
MSEEKVKVTVNFTDGSDSVFIAYSYDTSTTGNCINFFDNEGCLIRMIYTKCIKELIFQETT